MRTRLMGLTAALLLASVSLAMAQAQEKPAEPAAPMPTLGTVDFGFRVTGTSGDEARYERYRDLRNGLNANIAVAKEGADYVFDAKLENIGYRDGRYQANYRNGIVKFTFMYDAIPLNYSYDTSTPWLLTTQGNTAVFTLDTATRVNCQNNPTTCIPRTAAQAAVASPYRTQAIPLDVQSQRQTFTIGMVVEATKDLSALFRFNSYTRKGNMPYGASFAFVDANELPVPIDNRTTDLSAGIEWVGEQGMLHVGWDGSWFNNNINTLIWDNPLRATEYNNGLTPPNGPYDPNGYNSGPGSAQRGRMALAPNNSMNVLSVTGLRKLPGHSTLNGNFTVTSMKQNEALIPWTINSVVASPVVYGTFPGLAQLPRSTAEAELRGYNLGLNFNGRPIPVMGVNVRYRYNNKSNHTPVFDGNEYVRFDAVPEEITPEGESEYVNVTENKFDADASFRLPAYTTLKIGYGYQKYSHTVRAYSSLSDNTFRVSVDTVGTQYFSVRGIYEHTTRSGSGFDEEAITGGGAQPDLRFYDDAERTRDRGTVLFIVTPIPMVDINASVASGKDTYNGANQEFGLLDNKNTVYTVGINVAPKPQLAFGFNYGHTQYNSDQESRTANPDCTTPEGAPCPANGYNSWFDPYRNWAVANDETVQDFNLYFDLIKAIAKTDIRFGYDYSSSNNAYVHSGPRITALETNTPGNPLDTKPCSTGLTSCFEALAPVTNSWNRLTADLKYYFTPKVALGVTYWYEKFDITDYATIDLPGQPGTPRIDYLGELSTGYANRPYRGSTGFFRVFYMF